jgi:glycosyltransferase involved in cell wall biosynthesis
VGGTAARYAPPEDVEAFARELAAIAADPAAARARVAAAQSAARELTWARTAERTVAIYRAVVACSTRGRAWLPTVA